MERDPPACVIHQWRCCVWWSVCGHTPQLTVPALCLQKPREGQMERWGKLHNWDQRLSSWQMRRQCYNYSSSGLFLFFHLPFISQPCKRRPYAVSFVRTHSRGFASLRACVYMRWSKHSSENPIMGDMYWSAVLFKAFWDISRDISFNVKANGRKQTNLLLPSFRSLFLLLFFCFLLSVTPHQSLSDTLPFPLLPLSSRHHDFARRDTVLKTVLLSVSPRKPALFYMGL